MSGTPERDVSAGDDPVPCVYDIVHDSIGFRIDGKTYTFDYKNLPFTMVRRFTDIGSRMCADKSLILKHADKCQTSLTA